MRIDPSVRIQKDHIIPSPKKENGDKTIVARSPKVQDLKVDDEPSGDDPRKRPWTFIKNEQYYQRMVKINPGGFNITGQGVNQ